MNFKLLSTLFFALSIAIFASQIDAASDRDTLDGWIREAAKLGLGPAETGALSALKDILESVSSDSKRILGMTANDRQGMNGADEAVLRRLVTINGGVKSPKVRTLRELPKITLRAKMKLWLNGYDKETEEAEEDQDNAKRRVKMAYPLCALAVSVSAMEIHIYQTISADECKDEAPNCRENIFLCKNRFYVTLMHDLCKKTCAVCMRKNDAANCEDRNTADCHLWGHSFCANAAYSKGMKMRQCAKFCGLCPD
uniref:ShKT domain-containing protein n=1 Tax=Globodera pallida TaxID=36090 RepID=A0A183BM16_GLOPA